MMQRLSLLLVCGLVCLSGAASNTATAQSREEKVRNDKQKVEAEGYWLYNDLPRAVADAKKSSRPIIVVLRCIPCEECVKLDDELIDADARLQRLLDQFVRVRVVSTNGLDLSLFQFDTDQSFAVFLLNADGTIYGRYGTRSDRTEWTSDVSIDGLAKALQGALALHADYPQNKAALAGKRGPAPEFASPEKFPTLKDKYKATLDYQGNVVQSCIHCHQIGDAQRALVLNRTKTLPDTVLFPFPHPKAVGLTLDPSEMPTVLEVQADSPAAEAGFKPGDLIQSLNGQPLLSIADVQWVLHHASPEGATVRAAVARDGAKLQLSLKLPSGWRQRDDIAWRASSWELRRRALGGMYPVELSDDERQKLELPAESMALRLQHVGQYPPHNLAQQAGFRKGDIIVGIGTRTDLRRETDLLTHILRDSRPGDKITFTILRNGARQTLSVVRPN